MQQTLELLPRVASIESTKEAFWDRLRAGGEEDCPCCGRFSKMYRRRFNSGTAAQLIKLYRLGGAHDYIHASDLILRGVTGTGDLTKAKYWGLIIPMPSSTPDKKASGCWKLTEKGIGFVRGFIQISESVLIFDDRIYGSSDKTINIQEALKTKFSYAKLMSWEPGE